MAIRFSTLSVIAGAVLVAACAEEPKAPDLGQLYDNAAMLETQDRNPVISIPGTLGSRLVDRESGVAIWGGENELGADPAVPENARLIALPIPKADEPFFSLKDEVRPRGVLRVAKASILGTILEVDIYRGVISTLIAGGYDFRETRRAEIEDRDVNLDSFEFPYDWRRDIVEAAWDLDYFIERKAEQVLETRREVFGDDAREPKFDIVAHSMGGLVTRYYLMYGTADLPDDGSLPEVTWAGARHVGRAVFVAPPNTGSVLSFENLVNGKTLGPLQPTYQPAVLGTHVSVYQLFPRTRHKRVKLKGTEEYIDIFDVENWDKYNWGMLHPDQDEVLAILMPDETSPTARRERAKRHVAKALARAEQFHRAIDRPVEVPEDLEIFLVVGGGFNTPSDVEFDPETGLVEITGFEEGDGVVLRASSLLDERQDGDFTLSVRSPLQFDSTLLLPEEHVDITKSAVFGDNLLFWLLQSQRGGEALVDPSKVPLKAEPFEGDTSSQRPDT